MKGGIGQEGDTYERHADAVADLVVQGKSAESLLDHRAGGAGGAQGAIQRSPIKTQYGEFKTTKYNAIGPAASEYGVDINLEFEPGANVDAKKIGLTQSIIYNVTGKDVVLDPSQSGRMVGSGDGKGSQIDRISPYSNPLYPADKPSAGDSLGKTPTVAGWGQHGFHYTEAGVLKHQKATLIDTPQLPGRGNNSKQVFETAALAVEGRQEGSYMGSVQWGWEVDAAGKYKKLDLTLKSADVPSTGFMTAAKLWNAGTTLGTVKTAMAPTTVYDNAFAAAFTVAKDTKVTINYPLLHNNEVYNSVTIADGPQAGQAGNIKTAELSDQRDGAATLDLPIQWVGTITVPPEKGKLATLRASGSDSGQVLADLPVGTRIKVMDDSKAFLHVEVDTAQKGIVLNQTSTKGKDAAGMVRGYVFKDLVAR